MYFNIQNCGQRIKQLRKSQGLTQEQVSAQLGIGDRHLRKLEQGDTCGSIDLLVEIANYFGVTLDYLLLGKHILATEKLKQQICDLIDSLQALENHL